MQRIMSKKDIENKKRELLSGMVICNAPKLSDHCKNKCFHGKLHEPETGIESCAKPQFCSLSLSGIRKVFCKKLAKKEINERIKNESL